jgi:hypothetical protein
LSLVLKLPNPIEIEVDTLGKILLENWNVSAMMSAEKITSLKEGDSRTFMEEFVYELGRKYDTKIKNKKEAYKSGERLDSVKNLTDQELEYIAKAYIEKEIENLLPFISEDGEEKESLLEINKSLREKIDNETYKDHLRRLANASLDSMKVQNKKLMDQFSSIAKKWREPLLKNSFAINKLDSQISDIISIKIPPIPKIQHPAQETNAHLSNVYAQLEKLTLLTEAEIEQARLLNEKTSSLLEASAESSEQAKRSIYIATFAIVISALLSLWSIIETRAGNYSSGVSLDKLITETISNGNNISSNNDELKKLINNISHEKEKYISITEIEAQQSNYLSKIEKILSQIEAKLSSDKQTNRKVNTSTANHP